MSIFKRFVVAVELLRFKKFDASRQRDGEKWDSVIRQRPHRALRR